MNPASMHTPSQFTPQVPPQRRQAPVSDLAIPSNVPPGAKPVFIYSVFPKELVAHRILRTYLEDQDHIWPPGSKDYDGNDISGEVQPQNRCLQRGQTTFIMPAAPRDGYSVLAIYPSYDNLRIVNTDANPDPQYREEFELKSTDAQFVAEDLVHYWGTRFVESSGHKVGLAIGKTRVPPSHVISSLHKGLEEYNKLLVAQIDRLTGPAAQMAITPAHVEAVHYLNLTRPWAGTFEPNKTCPHCAFSLGSTKLICPECNTHLPTFYKNMGVETADIPDRAVRENLQMLAKIPVKVPAGPVVPPVQQGQQGRGK